MKMGKIDEKQMDTATKNKLLITINSDNKN